MQIYHLKGVGEPSPPPKSIKYLWKETEEIINHGASRQGWSAGTGQPDCSIICPLQLFNIFFYHVHQLPCQSLYLFAYAYIKYMYICTYVYIKYMYSMCIYNVYICISVYNIYIYANIYTLMF